jgi:hypothetical protein
MTAKPAGWPGADDRVAPRDEGVEDCRSPLDTCKNVFYDGINNILYVICYMIYDMIHDI